MLTSTTDSPESSLWDTFFYKNPLFGTLNIEREEIESPVITPATSNEYQNLAPLSRLSVLPLPIRLLVNLKTEAEIEET